MSGFAMGWRLGIIPLPPTVLLFAIMELSVQRGVFAQIIPDDTLGSESSLVRQQDLRNLIAGGVIRDISLFHSLQKFNVNQRQQVYFINLEGIENILSRVTDKDPSAVLDKLGVLGDANLLLFVGGVIDRDARGGGLELAAVEGSGTVGLNINGSDLQLNIDPEVAWADISLTNEGAINNRRTVNTSEKIEVKGRSPDQVFPSCLSAKANSRAPADGRNLGQSQSLPVPESPVVEAQGWTIGANGNVILTAEVVDDCGDKVN